MKKWFFLFGLTGLPVCIYLFLQSFGSNQFDIPIYYKNGLSDTLGCENGQSSNQYFAPNYFEIDTLQQDLESGRVVVYDLGFLQSGDHRAKNNMLTFLNKFKKREDVVLYSLNLKGQNDDLLTAYDQFMFVQTTPEKILGFGRCGLRVNLSFDSAQQSFKGSQLVLCDKEQQIRGYYDAMDLKEIDRLNTELRILLNY